MLPAVSVGTLLASSDYSLTRSAVVLLPMQRALQISLRGLHPPLLRSPCERPSARDAPACISARRGMMLLQGGVCELCQFSCKLRVLTRPCTLIEHRSHSATNLRTRNPPTTDST